MTQVTIEQPNPQMVSLRAVSAKQSTSWKDKDCFVAKDVPRNDTRFVKSAIQFSYFEDKLYLEIISLLISGHFNTDGTNNSEFHEWIGEESNFYISLTSFT